MSLRVHLASPITYPRALDVHQYAVGSAASVLGHLREPDALVVSGAAPWRVRDVLAHLADTEQIARDTLVDGPRAFDRVAREHTDSEALAAAGVARLAGTDVAVLAASWARQAELVTGLLRRTPEDARVRWGFGVSAAAFLRARLMELWAHLVDITYALDEAGRPGAGLGPLEHPDVQQLVAELGVSTLPYALARARVRTAELDLDAVIGPARVELRIGAEVVRGPLVQWCRACTRRPAVTGLPGLQTTGPLAAAVVLHARCYL